MSVPVASALHPFIHPASCEIGTISIYTIALISLLAAQYRELGLATD